MRRLIVLGLAVLLLSGCTIQFHQIPGVDTEGDTTVVRLIVHWIGPPLVNGMSLGYESELVPGQRFILFWPEDGRDNYGNLAGLSKGVVLDEVIISLPQRAPDLETVFWPTLNGDPSPENTVHWFPGHVPDIDEWGRPIPPVHVLGYSGNCNGYNLASMNGQIGEITAIGRVEVVSVEFRVPTHHKRGQYRLDVPGSIPQESERFVYNFTASGYYDVVWMELDANGDPIPDTAETHEIHIPVDWFWVTWTGPVAVGPSGTCHSLDLIE